MSLILVLLHSAAILLFQDFVSELHVKLYEYLLLKFVIWLSLFMFDVSFHHTCLCILVGQLSVLKLMHNF